VRQYQCMTMCEQLNMFDVLKACSELNQLYIKDTYTSTANGKMVSWSGFNSNINITYIVLQLQDYKLWHKVTIFDKWLNIFASRLPNSSARLEWECYLLWEWLQAVQFVRMCFMVNNLLQILHSGVLVINKIRMGHSELQKHQNDSQQE